MLIAWGAILLIISILSNITRNSPMKLKPANRAEFYSVVVVLVGMLLTMNSRIDAIYQIIATK